MAEKMKLRYTYHGYEGWQEFDAEVKKIIQEDTGEDRWIQTMSMPPMGFPPPVTTECYEKLKSLKGVKVDIVEED